MHVDFYVYEHWRPDKGLCFYVGKGRKRRAWDMRKRNFAHRALVSKLTSIGLAVDVRIVASNLTEEVSHTIEIERIAFFGMNTLVNFTAGGKGPLRRPLSAESRARLRAANLGRPCAPETRAKLRAFNLGKKHTAETKAKISALGKGRELSAEARSKLSTSLTGKPKSASHRKSLSEAWKRRNETPVKAETKARISAALKGKSKSETHRANMVLAQQRRRLERMIG